MKKKQQQGLKVRLASKRDRDAAERWAAAYRSAEPCVWVGPDEEMRPLDGDDLATMLEEFAREGTFCAHHMLNPFVRNMQIGREYRELRAAGKTYEDAKADLIDRHEVSETTVMRAITKSKSGTRMT